MSPETEALFDKLADLIKGKFGEAASEAAGAHKAIQETETRLRESIGRSGAAIRAEMREMLQAISALETARQVEEAKDNGRKKVADVVSAASSGLVEVGELRADVRLLRQEMDDLKGLVKRLDGRLWGIVGASAAVGGAVAATITALTP